MVVPEPVAAIWTSQWFARVPTQHRVRRPDHTVLVDQTTVATKAHRWFCAFDLASNAVDQVEATATGTAHPNVIVFGDRQVTCAERIDLRVVEDAFILSGRNTAIGIGAARIGPRTNVAKSC